MVLGQAGFFNEEKKHSLAMRRQSLRRINLPQHSFSILKKGENKQAGILRYGVMANRVKLFLLQLCCQEPCNSEIMKMYLAIKWKPRIVGFLIYF